MIQFGLDRKAIAEACDNLYSVKCLLSKAYFEMSDISNQLRRQSGLYEIGVLLSRDANRLEELVSYTYHMIDVLDTSLMLYIECENCICEKYNQIKPAI